jgi:hypothetical protein
MMNDTERMLMTELCSAIATEQDSSKMLNLVEELNRLFELKEERLKQKQRGSSQSTSEQKDRLQKASDCLPEPNDSRHAS